MPIKHILFPFDFSRQGSQAAPFVRHVADRHAARVTLLGVVPPVWAAPPLGTPTIAPANAAEAQIDLKCRLNRALTKELAGVSVERAVDFGDPGLKISEYADRHAADLIMMPTHGFGVFRSLLIGSETAKVLHDAKCPVWTATHNEEQRSPAAPRTIVCAVDAKPETVTLLQWAEEFSHKMGATLKLLHVVPPISDWLALPSERELQEQVRTEAREKLEELMRLAKVTLPLRIAVGKIAETVTEESRQEDAHLILIGRGSVQSPLGRLRTHAYAIVQRSPCPVLSV